MHRGLPIAVLAGALGWSCDDVDEFEETFVDEVVIPGSAGPGSPFAADFGGELGALDLASSQGFVEAGVSPDEVDSIRLVEGTLAVDLGNPSLNDLSVYVESFALYVQSDGRPRTRLTRVDELPASAEVELPLADAPELLPFATDTGMRFDAEVQLATRPALNLRLITRLTIRVDIDLLGT